MNILLYPNKTKNIPSENLLSLINQIKKHNSTPYVLSESLDYFSSRNIEVNKYDSNVSYDMAFVLGGDGTILRFLRLKEIRSLPIVGINYGTLGYMTEIEMNQPELIDELLSGKYSIENRMMLEIKLLRNGTFEGESYYSLNDAIISNGPFTRLLSFELYCNGVLARAVRGNGIVISTPTGSTGYSMSAGGPVLDPNLEAIGTTFISPHSLGVKTCVFSSSSKLEIKNFNTRSAVIALTIDGKDEIELGKDDVVEITKANVTTKFVKVNRNSFLRTLSEKMSERGE